MPPKCPPLTEEQKAAKNLKMREKRAAESPEVREKRLLENRERIKAKKQRLDPVEQQTALEAHAVRQRKAREIQTPEKASVSRMKDRLQHQNVRCNQTTDEADERPEVNRQQIISYGRVENDGKIEQLQEETRAMMEQISLEREEYNEEILDLQQANEAEHHAEIVIVETEEERQHRLEYLAQNRRNRVTKTHQAAQKPLHNEELVPFHHCGQMDEVCHYCGARHFKGEKMSERKFRICCSKGKVILPPPRECPELLYHLFTNSHPKSPHFLKMIRNYNNALAFASMGAQIDSPPGRGPYCFRIHGQIYHDTTSVEYQHEDSAPKYAQLYFIDSSQANEFRASNPANVRCDRFLMEQLDSLLRQCNPYASMYKNMSQMAAEEDLLAEIEGRRSLEIGMIIRNDRRTQDERHYNSPTGEEIAVVFKSIDGAPPENRDIRGHLLIPRRGNRFIRIDTQKPMCDPMTYPLLFPNGDNG
ncbi:uncharacterized protein LOC130696096 [Daphnia carinata]|uniref:uncharacterized protein LOC130696096 n=1 Tax=Daphnia carinata TaxID=120202 RepID=UPI00257D8816|nr:uncharacterized protein LOC130696096 [Daphnia carinata]